MHRETLIAVLLGFAGGILVALFLIIVPKNLPKNDKQATTPTPQPTVVVNKTDLTIDTPSEGQLVSTTDIKVNGKAAPNSQIIVSSPVEDIVTTTNDQGNFSETISLIIGENLLSVTAFNTDGNENKQLKVFSSVTEL